MARVTSPALVAERLANFFYVRPRLALAALLGPPFVWLVVIYLGSLGGLVLQSLFTWTASAARWCTSSPWPPMPSC